MILESPGFPIGLAEDAYEERSVRLAAGDRLYLYSDGVPEAMNPAGERFGDARLLEAIGRGRAEPLRGGDRRPPGGGRAVAGRRETPGRHLHPGGRGLPGLNVLKPWPISVRPETDFKSASPAMIAPNRFKGRRCLSVRALAWTAIGVSEPSSFPRSGSRLD